MKPRLMELLGMVLVGDGVLNLLEPRRHTALWICGPAAYKKAAAKLEMHPAIARGLGFALLGTGICIARNLGKFRA